VAPATRMLDGRSADRRWMVVLVMCVRSL
jgi:hypothetical protein